MLSLLQGNFVPVLSLGLCLQCLDEEERKQVMEEAHASVGSAHWSRLTLHD